MNQPHSREEPSAEGGLEGPAALASDLAAISAEHQAVDNHEVKLAELHDGDNWRLRLTTGEPNVRRDGSPSGNLDVTIHNVGGEYKAMIENLGAKKKRQGDSTRMMQALVVELKHRGVRELWSYDVSAEALKFREQFFSEANAKLHFYDQEHPENGFLPVDVEQAIETAGIRPEGEYYNFGICVDLNEVDESAWSQATPIQGKVAPDDFSIPPRIPTNLSLPQNRI